MAEKQPILSLKDIRKVYPGVIALNNVSIDFYPGEVHALIGENGAGKSTFIKTITGAHAPDGGSITVDGETYSAMTPPLARKHGIECIYQEFNLIDVLSAAENICYGERYGMLVNQKKMRSIAQEIFDDFGVDIDPGTLVRDLTPGHMQIVEIAKAVSKNARILILDEPTAPLSVAEVEILFRIVRRLRDQGVAIIFISHRLDEVFELTDRVSILRDGEYITTLNTAKTNRAELIRYMVGREMTQTFPPRHAQIGEVALELRNLTGNGVKNISFQAHKGEVLGISGLVGEVKTQTPAKKKTEEEDEFRLQFIRGGIMKTPEISVFQAQKEIVSFGEKMEKMWEMTKELYSTPEDNFQKLFDRIQKYEDTSDKMENEIGRYLGEVGDAHLSDDTKEKIRSMLRQIGELESIGDSFYNLARIFRRKRDNKIEFTKAQESGVNEMFTLLGEAITQMNASLSGRREDQDISVSSNIEQRINACRNSLKQKNIESLDRHEYGYDNGTVFIDIIGECEKSGDYVINVVEARLGAARNGIRFKGIQIDTDSKIVTVDGETVSFTKTEYQILKLFLLNPGHTYSRGELLKEAWPDDVIVSARTVDVNITHIRRKIGPYASHLVTRSGFGYCFLEENPQ